MVLNFCVVFAFLNLACYKRLRKVKINGKNFLEFYFFFGSWCNLTKMYT